MCVEIIKPNGKFPYKCELPFEEQLSGSKEVIVDCGPTCEKVAKFFDEIERICNQGQVLNFNIKLKNKDSLQLYKRTKHFAKENIMNDIIGKLAQFHKKADDGLKELSEMCYKGKCGR